MKHTLRLLLLWVLVFERFLIPFAKSAKQSPIGDEGKHLIQKCINDNQPRWIRSDVMGTTWRRTLLDLGSRFDVLGAWWSKHGPPSSMPLSDGVTIVTHLAFDERLMLKQLCRSWQGPLSAVIHFTTMEKIATRRDSGTGRQPQDDDGAAAMHPAGFSERESDIAHWTDDGADVEGDQTESELEASSQEVEFDPGSMEFTDSSKLQRGVARNSATAGVVAPGAGSASMDSSVDSSMISGGRSTAKRRGRSLHQQGGSGSGGAANASLGYRVRTVKEARRHAKGLHEALERMNACQADIMLVHEVYSDRRSLAMYPGPLLQVKSPCCF